MTGVTGILSLVDNSAQHPAATSALREVANYLHYTNILMYPLIYIKWFFVKLIYGIANWASQFMASMLNVSSFVNQITGQGEVGQMVNAARTAAAVLMVLALIWVGVKIIVNHEPPQIKNVVIQLLVSVFLLTNLGTLTEWVTSEGVSIAQGFLGQNSQTDKNSPSYKTSDLPFKIVKATTNDNEYLINTNFAKTGVSLKKVTKDTDSLTPPKVKYGFNNLSKSDVDAGNINFYKIIDWNDVDDNMPLSNKDADWKGNDDDKTGKHFLYGWLKYHTDAVPATNKGKSKKDQDKIEWHSPDIPRWGGTGNSSSLSWGGYPRFEVNWIPCIVSLLVLTAAYLFAGYVIVKSFLELVLMNILGLFLIGSDLSTGQKTKQVVSEIFSASLLIALQAFELAFYEASVSWAIDGLKDNMWGFMVFMLAASIIVITGSQKVTKFFGVDTGAQHGLQAAGSVIYAGKQIGKGAAALGGFAAGTAMAPSRAVSAIKNNRDKIGHKFNTKGSMKRDAKNQAKQAARQNAIDKMAGFDRNGNRTVDDFDKENKGNGKNLIHQTAASERAANQAYRKAAKGTRQADIRQRRRDAIALGASALAGDKDAWRKATGQSGKPLKQAMKQFKEGKLMKRDQFYDELNRQTQPHNSNIGAVNQSGPTSLGNYHNWQKRAQAYDKENGLSGTRSGVGINPETGKEYSYDEWRNNANDVRTNDVPDTNLDGTKFVPPTDPATEEPESVEEFDQRKNFDTNDDDHKPPFNPPTGGGNGGNVPSSSNNGTQKIDKQNIPYSKGNGTRTNSTPKNNRNNSKFVDDLNQNKRPPKVQNPTNNKGNNQAKPFYNNGGTHISNAYSEQSSGPSYANENPETVQTQPTSTSSENHIPELTQSESQKTVDDIDNKPHTISNAYSEDSIPETHNSFAKEIQNKPVNTSTSTTDVPSAPTSNTRTVEDLPHEKISDPENNVNFNQAASQSSKPSTPVKEFHNPNPAPMTHKSNPAYGHNPKSIKKRKAPNRINERRNIKRPKTSNGRSQRTFK